MPPPETDDAGAPARPPHPDPGPSLAADPSSSRPIPAGGLDESLRIAIGALDLFAPALGWGILGWGLLRGASRTIGALAQAPAIGPIGIGVALDALAFVVASGLTGWAAAVATRLAGAAILARMERDSRAFEERRDLAERAIAAADRLAEALGRRPAGVAAEEASGRERSELLAEIDRALHSGQLAEATRLLGALDAGFPGDPAAGERRVRVEAARRAEVEGQVARIDAARQVNDPGRVLELYRAVASDLELDRRGELERRLSKWFLELIHRRLRGGRIQAEVVELASQVAETFGATVEGASLRASLPMLRRSVGLCPRCAEPYAGTADACPKCRAAAADHPAADEAGPGEVAEEEAEPGERPGPDEGDPDAGWLRYDEDDGDGRVRPA